MRFLAVILMLTALCPPCFPGDEPPVSTTDKDGNTIVIGAFTGRSFPFQASLLNHDSTGQSTDIYTVKYDRNSQLLWSFTAGGNGYDHCQAVTTDKDGNIYIAGHFRSPLFSIGSFQFTNAQSDGTDADIFIAKLGPAGKVIWAKSAGGKNNDRGVALKTDTAGKIILTGTTLSPSLVFGNKTLQNAQNAMGLEYEAVFDTDGNCLTLVEKDADLKELRKDFQEQFNKCLGENNIKITCAGCTGANITLEVQIGSSGEMSASILTNISVCREDLAQKVKECMLGFLQSRQFPPALRGIKIELNASRVLKC